MPGPHVPRATLLDAIALLAVAMLALAGFGYARLRREVHERRRVEYDLREQLAFRSALFDILPFPMAVRDQHGVFVEVNTAMTEAVGLARERLIGRSQAQWGEDIQIDATTSRRFMQLMRDPRASERVRVEYVNASGTPKHGLFWQRPFHHGNGELAGTISLSIDITALIEAEHAVLESRALLEDVTRNLPAGVFQMVRQPDGELRYRYTGGDLKLLPTTPAGALWHDPTGTAMRLSDDDTARLMALLETSARSAEAIIEDFEVGTPAAPRFLRLKAIPRQLEGGVVLWDGYWTEITRERLYRAEVEEARNTAERVSEARSRFVAMMSHEIRTPMSGVLGLVEVLAQSELHGEQIAMVSMIHDSAGALLQILDDILDYSKIEAARLTFEHEPFDLREVCDLAMGLLSARAHEKGLTLRCRVSGAVAALHRGDSGRLRQVLFNLLGNATKFTSAGSVSLEVDVEDDTGDQQMLSIHVIDTGIGIEEKLIEKLFSPFVQAESSTSRRFGGTGLGLAISQRLVDLMGGTLTMTSQPGKGTRVTVRVPLPVVRRHAEAGALGRLRATVRVRDAELARALADGLAGLQVALADPHAGFAHDERMLDAVFLDDGASVPDDCRHMRVIHVTERAKAAGYRLTADDIRVSINPLSTRGLRAVCNAAVGVDADLLHTSGGTASAPVARKQRSREQAIADGTLILVAEDNPVNRHLIEKQLSLLGCVCDAHEDGEAAWQAYLANRYAILITDCHMPIVNGYTLATRIREHEARTVTNGSPAAHLPIIGVTASVEPEERAHCLDAGMDDCVRKPVQLDTLRTSLVQWAPACFGKSAAAGAEAPEKTDSDAHGESNPQSESESGLPPLNWAAICGEHSGAGRDDKLVRVLVDSLGADAAQLHDLLAPLDIPGLRQWLHRVTGTAAFLHYAPISTLLDEFRAVVTGGDAAAIQEASVGVFARLATITAHLARQ